MSAAFTHPRAASTPSDAKRGRASVVPTVSQPSADAHSFQQVGGFALAAIAHIKPPAVVKQ